MIRLLLVMMFIILISENVFCYEANVHREITNKAIAASNIQHALDNLKISLSTKFDNETVDEWIADGSELEDNSPRWVNHFYDPTTGKGLTDMLTGEPSLQWGKDSPSNVNSWKWARDAYYKALTGSNPNFRNTYFSYVFQDLGQIMHLVQDLTVPAHVRNDAHPYYFENSLQDQRDMYEKYTKTATLTFDGYPAVDLTTFNIFDSFWINGGKGIAEYTNSNFLSRDTNIDNQAYARYNAPVAIGETVTTQQVYDPYLRATLDVWVKFYQGYATDRYRPEKSAPIGHLATFSYFDYEMNRLWGKRVFSLSNAVHKDYASLLIPRAVGYSAGLLNYFFRGEMEASALEKMDTDGNITDLLVNIKNITPGETMKDGSFAVSYRYKPSGSSEYIYGTSATASSGELLYIGDSRQYSFSTAQYSPRGGLIAPYIPKDATEKQYALIFQGTLGAEVGAVVGKVIPVTPAQIDVTYPERFVYAIVDDGSSSGFNKLRARLRNNTQGIDMTGGSIIAKAKYKRHLNHMDDLSTEPPYSENRSSDFYYSASLPVAVSLDNTNYKEVEFDFSNNPIPFGVTDLYLEVTYRKENSVIAVSVKDLNEPQYIGVWNSHDRFLMDVDTNSGDDIHDWKLLTEAEIMSNPALVDMLDYDNQGLVDEPIDAMNVNYDLYFSATPLSGLPSTYHATFNNLPPGRYGRVAVITDRPYFYVKFHEKYTSSIEDVLGSGRYLGYDGNITYVIPGVTNQEKEGTYYYTPIYSFRDIPNHFSYISLSMYPEPATMLEKNILIKEAEWPAPADNAPYPAASLNP